MATATAIASGVKETETRETWTCWWLFPKTSQDRAELIAYDQLGLCEDAGHPGGTYARRPIIRHSRSYTLILQRGGLDI